MDDFRQMLTTMTPEEFRAASRERELEEAVRREVLEEASIEVKDLRYFGSQTWPFPSNIMVAFRAEYASGELLPDGDEVVESGWFDRDHLPEIPLKGSIARAMIDAWLSGKV